MNRSREIGTDAAVAAPEDPRAPQQDADPVVLIDELARILKTSTRNLQRQLRAGTFFIPELPKVDRRHRWSRVVVAQYIAEGHALVHERKATAGLRVVPRKPAGEAARERGRR